MLPQAKPTTSATHHNQKTNTHMSNTNNKIPIVSLNKSDICRNTEHPIPSEEINPNSQNIPQTICAIYLINRPQPRCCFDFSAALILSRFFCRTFSAAIFLSHFFCHTFSTAIFLPQCFCHTFSITLFLPHFSCHTFSTALFLLQTFSINNTYPNNISQKYVFNDIQV
jgi:hypothetical protein